MTLTLAILLSLLLVAGASAILFIYWVLIYWPHPRIEGRLRLPGLADSVEVLRDRWGVPHVYARTESDLWFAQGFVQAQDRFWQMELFRRLAAGRISEGVGDEGLTIDRLARIVGFRRSADAQLSQLSADARAVLERHGAGVNAYLERYRRRLPMEFTLLGIKPDPWTPTDTIAISLLLGWMLSSNWQEELVRAGLYSRLGPERAAELLPDEPKANPAVLPGELTADLSQLLLDAYKGMADYIGLTAPGQGSNNWVVNGGRSITGKPMLANDPHLTVTMPGLWHLIHLEAEQGMAGEPIRLIGGALPGTPGILVGHNQHIAWGATIAFPDSVDLYVERRHPQHEDLFLHRDQWEKAQVWEETITVRGRKEPVRQLVTVTRHGPLMTDLLAPYEASLPPLAVRWVGHEPGCTVNAFLGLMRARSWEEFRQASGKVVTPALSLVYADPQDNIGYIAAALVPVRGQGRGLVPAPGHTGDHEWVGFIPADEMPHSFNPPIGRLLSANNRVVPDDYPYWWGIDHYPGYRARRIAELIESRPKLSLRDMQAFQLDTYNHLGRAIAPYFTLIDPKDPWERQAQKALVEWNYRMDTDSAAALVFEITLYHLLQLVFVDKLGPLAGDYIGIPRLREFGGGAFASQSQVKLAELLEQEENWWFGEGSTGAPRTREELLSLALKRAVATIKKEVSDDARRWHWGRLHQVFWRHPLGNLRLFRGLLNRGPFPVSGSAQTINAQHLEYSLPFRTVSVAPTFRMVIDVANWDRSLFVTCPGQSGLPGHRFYDNLMHIWLEGDMFPMAFSRAQVEESDPLYRLKLTPT